jgi:dienelactone hydrolase
MHWLRIIIIALALLFQAPAFAAQVSVHNERILFNAAIGGKDYQLEAMLYLPQDGKTRHPLIIMTHGRNGPHPWANPRQIDSYRALNGELAERGYLVMMLVRRGYGHSQGPDSEFLDTAESSGIAGAEDVKSAIAFMRSRSDIDVNRIVIMGQSQGGWIALAASTLVMEGVRGVVNISGAINFREGEGKNIRSHYVETSLEKCAASFGKAAKVPTLWLYSENDNHLPSAVNEWFSAFSRGGGKGRLIIKPPYKNKGHAFVSDPSIYLGDLLKFFIEIGVAVD